jgi:hypothetical protein
MLECAIDHDSRSILECAIDHDGCTAGLKCTSDASLMQRLIFHRSVLISFSTPKSIKYHDQNSPSILPEKGFNKEAQRVSKANHVLGQIYHRVSRIPVI